MCSLLWIKLKPIIVLVLGFFICVLSPFSNTTLFRISYVDFMSVHYYYPWKIPSRMFFKQFIDLIFLRHLKFWSPYSMENEPSCTPCCQFHVLQLFYEPNYKAKKFLPSLILTRYFFIFILYLVLLMLLGPSPLFFVYKQKSLIYLLIYLF